MDHKNHDKVFYSTFAVVLGVLFGIFFVCIIAARWITPDPPPDEEAYARMEARLKPSGTVITDAAMLVKTAAAAPARAPMTGEQVASKVCAACHNAGLLGAPKTGDKAAWTARGSLDALVASSVKGKNAMPPRGGDPSLSDAELRAAIEAMIK